jgi:hypothetical protein
MARQSGDIPTWRDRHTLPGFRRISTDSREPLRRSVHYQRRTGHDMRCSSMSSLSYRSSRPDVWVMPRPHRDPSLRYMTHGPILPMEEPGFFARLFRRG